MVLSKFRLHFNVLIHSRKPALENNFLEDLSQKGNIDSRSPWGFLHIVVLGASTNEK